MQAPTPPRLAVIGRGRLGTALVGAARGAGIDVGESPLGRGATPTAADVVVLCVPDREIGAAAALVPAGPLVAHTSGAGSLDLLAPHARRGVLHPLRSVPHGVRTLRGAHAAVRAADPGDVAILRDLAGRLGMTAMQVADADRTAYHAAASLASNALVALHVAASELARTAGVPADALGDLARGAVEQVSRDGSAALTGPAARGDWATVAAQRAAVAERTPHLLPLFDAATDACARIAGTHPVPTDVHDPSGRFAAATP